MSTISKTQKGKDRFINADRYKKRMQLKDLPRIQDAMQSVREVYEAIDAANEFFRVTGDKYGVNRTIIARGMALKLHDQLKLILVTD